MAIVKTTLCEMNSKKLNRNLIIIVLACAIIPLSIGCNKTQHIEGDWIVVNLEYDNVNITEYLEGVINMTIDLTYNQYGSTPTVRYGKFSDKSNLNDGRYTVYKQNGKMYITIIGSEFFTDTFEVNCLSKSCCSIELRNKLKKIDLVYNSELGVLGRRRDCPYLTEGLIDSLSK